ncbi:MAG: HAMP domain-containing protein [Streptosporangiales bacterium]|nr:HAMP domain-containing protein [Streptosporangiales bacterium]
MSVRLRLTLLYGGMFFLAGALLLAVMYFLVRQILDSLVVLPLGSLDLFQDPRQVADQFASAALDRLLRQSLVALAGVGIAALILGWFVADRALAPLNKVTATARRLSESTLHERIALEGPQDEIKELADTFDAMLDRLHAAFDSERRFVANASHELRTPLAVNRTLLEVALADPEASEDLKAVGRTLLATNARSERLIEGLLLLARSERALTTRKRVSLDDLAAAALDAVGDEVAGRDATVHRELAPAPTMGEPVLLEQLVLNLVQNAVRHNVDGGEIVLRTSAMNGSTVLQVENTGPVVPAHDVEGLFDPFRRHQPERVGSDRGAGLGLSIVRSVAKAHGGAVTAAPRSGGGLVITVRLPSG